MSYSNLVFCVQLASAVVLLQSCCTSWSVVSGGAVRTSSTASAAAGTIATTPAMTPTVRPLGHVATTTQMATMVGEGGNVSVASSITAGPPASSGGGAGSSRTGRAWSFGSMQKYDLPGELGQPCSGPDGCRQFAYECDQKKRTCECADGYMPDPAKSVCVGAVGRRCHYDSHCIANAFCKGQMVCTCKREFGYLSADKWSCQASSASSLLLPPHRMSWPWFPSMMALRGAAIIIPLLLVSSSYSSSNGNIW